MRYVSLSRQYGNAAIRQNSNKILRQTNQLKFKIRCPLASDFSLHVYFYLQMKLF